MQYIDYHLYRSGLSNTLMSLEIGAILAYLLDRPLRIINLGSIVGGNSLAAKNHYRHEVSNDRIPTILDLFDVPVPFLIGTPTLRGESRRAVGRLFHRNGEFSHLLNSCVTYSNRSLVELENDDDFRSFRNDRTNNFELSEYGVESDVLLTNPIGYLGNYEYIFYIEDPAVRQNVYRLLRHLRPKPEYIEFAHQLLRQLNVFNSVHVRLSDYKSWATADMETIADNIAAIIPTDERLLVLTDESQEKKYFAPLINRFRHALFLDEFIVNENFAEFSRLPFHENIVIALVSQYIAARSRNFIGHPTSTFTGAIQRMRFFDFLDDDALYIFSHAKFELDASLRLRKRNPRARYTWNQRDLPYGSDFITWACRFPECAYLYNEAYFGKAISRKQAESGSDAVTVDLKFVPQPVSGFTSKRKRGKTLLYRAGGRNAFKCNETAALIWRLLDGQRSVEACVELLAEIYPSSKPDMEADVCNIVKQFHRAGLLQNDPDRNNNTSPVDRGLCVLYHAPDDKPAMDLQARLLEASLRRMSPKMPTVRLYGEFDHLWPNVNRWNAISKFLEKSPIEGCVLIPDCDMLFVRSVFIETTPGTVVCQSWPGLSYGLEPYKTVIDYYMDILFQDSRDNRRESLKREFLDGLVFVFPYPFIIHTRDLRIMAPRMIEIMQILMQHPLGISAIPDMLGAVLYFREDELTVKSVAEFGVCNDWPTTSFSDYSIIHYCQPIDYKNGVRTHKSLPDFFDTLRTHPVDEIESANVATNKQLVRLVTNLFDADDGVVGSWKPGKIVNDAPQISKNHSDRNTVTGLETHSQVGQDRWVIETLGNQSSGFFVDIGAGDGIELSNTYLLEKRLGWRGIAVEPNPSFFERLQANRSCVKESSCIVSAQKDGGRFDLVLDGHLSAISDCCNKVLENSQEYRPRVSVAGISLAHLLDKYSAPRVIDYLSIDIEGGEYDVLKGFPFEQYTFQTITVEVNAYLGREQLCRRDDIRILLESNGYRFVRASDHLGIDDFYVYASVM